jgi:hypothetical protein
MIDTERQRPTDADLEAESRITDEDIARAIAVWDRDSGVPGLLDAERGEVLNAGEMTAE